MSLILGTIILYLLPSYYEQLGVPPETVCINVSVICIYQEAERVRNLEQYAKYRKEKSDYEQDEYKYINKPPLH